MPTFLRCHISPGLFSGEFAITGETPVGEEFSLFASEEDVDFDAPVVEAAVQGWVRVVILDGDDDLLLVRLPAKTFENGPTVTVRRSQVQERKPREIA